MSSKHRTRSLIIDDPHSLTRKMWRGSGSNIAIPVRRPPQKHRQPVGLRIREGMLVHWLSVDLLPLPLLPPGVSTPCSDASTPTAIISEPHATTFRRQSDSPNTLLERE